MDHLEKIESEFTEELIYALNWQDNFSATLTHQMSMSPEKMEKIRGVAVIRYQTDSLFYGRVTSIVRKLMEILREE